MRFTPDYYVIGGDLNLALNVKLDRKGTICNNSKLAEWLNSWLDANGMLDAWRHMHPDSLGYTWHRTHPTLAFSRLDYLIVNQEMEQFLNLVEIKSSFHLNHSIVVMIFNLEPGARVIGLGYWKFNTSLLRDRDYLEKINTLMDIELSQQGCTAMQKWESIKLAVRGSTIQYAMRKKKSNENKLQVLERKLEKLDKELINGTLFQDKYEQIRLMCVEINELRKIKTRGRSLD